MPTTYKVRQSYLQHFKIFYTQHHSIVLVLKDIHVSYASKESYFGYFGDHIVIFFMRKQRMFLETEYDNMVDINEL